ncbi:MAG: triphosphoribosyl-dephospho-CoA synthase, partial [Fusobacteriaceae bacterium]
RKGIEVLKIVQRESEELIDNFTLEKACQLEKTYIDRGISPGGSADLLAVTILLHEGYKVFKSV